MSTTISIGTAKIGFIGVGRYASALLDGILSSQANAGPVANRLTVYVHDRAPERATTFSERFPSVVRVCRTAKEVVEQSDLHVVGVPSSALSNLFSEIGLDHPSPHNPKEQFVFMDGHEGIDALASAGGFAYGKVMFNEWVRITRGVVAFWPGSLDQRHVEFLKSLLNPLGTVWIAREPHLLQVVRATAGCGNGVLTELLVAMQGAFSELGLTKTQADESIRSIVTGLHSYLERGGDVSRLAESTCSGGNSLMRALLDSPNRATAKSAVSEWMMSIQKQLPHI
jgi:pyrroline-5-carboxylate reductase